MLTALFGSIQSAFTSIARGFVIVSLVPTILFLAANFGILSVVDSDLYKALNVADLLNASKSPWVAGVTVASAALVFSALLPLLYRLTEGEALPAFLRWFGHSVQRHRLDNIHDRARSLEVLKVGIDSGYEGWMAKLALPPGNIGGSVLPASTRRFIRKLELRRQLGWEIPIASIQKAVDALHICLMGGGAAATPPDLRDARRKLNRIILYVRERVKYENRNVHNQLQATFPGQVFDPNVSTDNILASTAFGNIGRTMRSYALRRYGMDLDIFWTRFEKPMADGSNKLPDNLAAQKSQVDFLVNMLWLTLLTGFFWIPTLWIEGAHPVLFVGVAIAAPALAWLFYDAACRAYLVFADQLRTAVDFFRFDVLNQLNIGLPNGTDDEEMLWERLGNRIGYGRKDATFIYVRK
jgi:hypothetical protein